MDFSSSAYNMKHLGRISDFGEISEDDVAVPKSVRRDAEKERTNSGNLIDGTWTAEIPQLDPAGEVPQVGRDVTGAYNGVVFKTGVGDWNTTFGADGWEFEMDSEGTYSFVVAHNAKYKGAELYLYSKGYMADTADVSSVTDVKANRFHGYRIDASYSEEKPPMNWRGGPLGRMFWPYMAPRRLALMGV